MPLTVLVTMLGEGGHLPGTWRLARALRDSGHRVVYLALADYAEQVAAQGFEVVRFAEDLLPRGYVESFGAEQRAGGARGPRHEVTFRAWLERIEGGELDGVLATLRPDVVLCDALLWAFALRARRAGAPVVSLAVILSGWANSRIPPFTSWLTPGEGAVGSARVRAAWAWMRFADLFRKRMASRLSGAYRHPTRMHHLVGLFKAMSARAGLSATEGRDWHYTEVGPRLILPEIVLCPSIFQHDGGPGRGGAGAPSLSLGDVVDVGREEPPLDLPIDKNRSIVLCSAGTNPAAYPHAPRFFRAAAELARSRPDLQVVLQVGNRAADAPGDGALDNLIVRPWVPQLRVLRQAAAMVTHGGINSVLECVKLAVPMVIVPGGRDQPGNAVRSVQRGVARAARMDGITAGGLAAELDAVRADPGVRRALRQLQAAFDQEPGLPDAVAFIEGIATRAR